MPPTPPINLLPFAQDSASEPPTRPALDLEPLAAFDRALAASAMGLMFSGGHRETALAWADRLDPLQEAEHAPFGRRRLGYAGKCSMVEWALATADLEAMRILCQTPKTRDELFVNRAEKIAGCCAEAIKEGFEEMANFLLEGMSPMTPKESARYTPTGWVELTKAAAQSRRADWLARALELRAQAGHPCSGSEAGSIASACFVPGPSGSAKEGWFEPGIAALREAGVFSHLECSRLAEAYAKASPPNWERAGETLQEAAELIRERAKKEELSGWSRFNPDLEIEGLFYWSASKPLETPPEWVKLAMGLGVSPFYQEGDRDGREPPALRLLTLDDSRSAYLPEDKKEAHRSERDERTAALLAAMIESGASGVDHHYALSDARLKGARKISLLALAGVEGLWESARLLADHGVDVKTAAKQIGSHMAEGPRKAMAMAFFEGLALEGASSKASASRDRRLAKKGEAPPEPSRPMRL